MKRLWIIIFLTFHLQYINAQPQIYAWDSIKIVENGQQLKNPFLGGFNNPVFTSGDLDNDGIEDLVVFEKAEATIYTFKNNGTPNTVDYEYKPELGKHFPPIRSFVFLNDYNCDGIPDLFTQSQSGAGIGVYQGSYTAANELTFTLAKFQLTYPSGGFPVNIYVDALKLPSIADVDNDSDLDVLVFEQYGATIGYYRNMSIESGYGCDSLIFSQVSNCWGYICECSNTNIITLDYTHPFCFYNYKRSTGSGPDTIQARHLGSTLTSFDYDKDGYLDILVGDVAYNNLIFLKNTQNAIRDSMIYLDTLFPSNSQPVDLPTFPAAYYLDINNDSLNDLIIAPFAPNYCRLYASDDTSANVNNVWLYKNIGSMSGDSFQLETRKFLIEDMIDIGENAQPVFFDYNADGLMDIIAGNCVRVDDSTRLNNGLSVYENTGTLSAPEYTLVDTDYAGVSSYGLYALHPAFGDMDGDGDMDMILGESDGNFYYFTNTAATGNPANFVFTTSNFQGLNAGSYSTPQIVDVNKDGLPDLISGESQGRIFYYENFGTSSSPFLQLSSNFWGSVDVRGGDIFGFSVPVLTDTDNDNKYELIVGSASGKIYYYDEIEAGNPFKLIDTAWIKHKLGTRSAPAVGDINQDGYLDFVVGINRGGFAFFSLNAFVGLEQKFIATKVQIFPNPAGEFIRVVADKSLDPNKVEIFNVLGKQYHLDILSVGSMLEISLKNLPKGIYFLKLQTGNEIVIKKVIKQ